MSPEQAIERIQAGVFVTQGYGSDMDESYDDAARSAHDHGGVDSVLPNVAHCDPGGVIPVDRALSSLGSALSYAHNALATGALEPGQCFAVAFAKDSMFRRRRLVLAALTDLSLTLGDVPGPIIPSAELVAQLLAATGTQLEDHEWVESIQLRRVSARYKPVVTKTVGKDRKVFVVTLAHDDVVLASAPTATAAARAASALCKAGPVNGIANAVLEVSARVRREDGSPPITVARTLVSRRASVLMVAAQAKRPDALAVHGFVFYGRIPSAA